ncbi:MAG: energy transducer TonB [Bacteroidia bacterium]|jgi:TonB family protein
MKKGIIIVFLLQLSFLYAQNSNGQLETVAGNSNGDETIVVKNSSEKNEIFSIVENMPEFPGGAEAMKSFVKENLVYPEEEYKKGISGTCYVTFVVGTDGKLNDIKVLRGIPNGELCNKEAVNVVKKMPVWIPGKQNGKNVSVQYNLPIKFTSNNKQNELVAKTPPEQNGFKDTAAVKSDKQQVFTTVEQMPEFPGGSKKMMEFIQKNINYPEEDLKKGISGTCYLTFNVDETGEIRDVKVLRGITNGQLCDAEAVRVVKSMPKWIPGKQNGKEVSVQYNLPIKFTPPNDVIKTH